MTKIPVSKKSLPHYVKAYDPWCVVFFVEPVVIPLVPVLAALRIHPNVVTVVSLVCNISAGVLFALGGWGWAAGLFLATFYLDAMDGKLARYRKMVSQFGARLDGWSDYLRRPLSYLGIGIYFYANAQYLSVFFTGVMLIVHLGVHKLYPVLVVSQFDLEFPDFHRKFIRRFAPRVVSLYTYFDELFIMFIVVPIIAVCAGLPERAVLFLWGAVIAIALCFAKAILLWNYRRKGQYDRVHQPWGDPKWDFAHRT